MSRTSVLLLLLVLLAAGLPACTDPVVDGEGGDRPLDLRRPLPTASLEAQDIDRAQFEAALETAGQIANLQSLVVVRNGFVVEDRRFDGADGDRLDSLHTATQGVMAALVGTALADGLFDNVDQPIRLYLDRPELRDEKREIRIRHLLNNTAGLAWTDEDLPLMRASDDPVGYVLGQTLVARPGDTFRTNPGLAHLLSSMIAGAAGRSTAAYARDRLFEPLGIDRFSWPALADGVVDGAAGLELRPLDWAKLGVLFLQRGRSAERRVVSEEWIDRATNFQVDVPWSYAPLAELQFGFLWWRVAETRFGAYFAWGYGGQHLYVVPALDLVVVTTASPTVTRFEVDEQQRQILELILEGVMPAVRP